MERFVAARLQLHARLCPDAIACLPSRSEQEKGGRVNYANALEHSAVCCVAKLERWGAVGTI